MQKKFELTVNTKSGEDLYVYPYSIQYGTKQKYFYYRSAEFTANNTNEFFIRHYNNNLLANTLKLKNCIKDWLEVFSWQVPDFFGTAVFDKNFKYRTWNLKFSWFKCYWELSYILPAASVFGKNISLEGQLYIETNNKYVDDVYLAPTKQYFDERLEEWINEVNFQSFTDKFINRKYYSEKEIQEQIENEIKFRQEYKKWRDTKLVKGNTIEYLYSLNT